MSDGTEQSRFEIAGDQTELSDDAVRALARWLLTIEADPPVGEEKTGPTGANDLGGRRTDGPNP